MNTDIPAEKVREALLRSPSGYLSNEETLSAYKDLRKSLSALLAEPKAPVEEPTGDVVVFFSLGHPRMGVGWTADDGQWEDGTGHSLSWEQLVGDGTAKDVMLYRRVPYPEPSSSPAEESS